MRMLIISQLHLFFQEKLGGNIAIGENIRLVQDVFAGVFNLGPNFQRDGSQFDKLFADGETFRLGELTASVIYTPGHTPACVCYLHFALEVHNGPSLSHFFGGAGVPNLDTRPRHAFCFCRKGDRKN